MGGGLFDTKRLSKEEFEEYVKLITPMLTSCLQGLQWSIVPYYKSKEDFGDLDIVVEGKVEDVRDRINAEFGGREKIDRPRMSINDGTISFEWKKFQVDVVCTKPENYRTTLSYFSYNDVGNILGRIYHKMGLKLGNEGLLYPIKDDEERIVSEVVVSKNQVKILSFLGLNYYTWLKGFDDLNEMFSWATNSIFFDPSIFQEERLSAISRKRNRKRKTFSKFLIWLDENKPASKHTVHSKDNRLKYLSEIEEFFEVDIRSEIIKAHELILKKKKLSEKFNGRMVMELTGLAGKELGEFMTSFKTHIETSEEFEEFINNKSVEDIKEKIKTFNR